MEVLDEVLQQVHTFLYFDFVHFEKVLQKPKNPTMKNLTLFNITSFSYGYF